MPATKRPHRRAGACDSWHWFGGGRQEPGRAQPPRLTKLAPIVNLQFGYWTDGGRPDPRTAAARCSRARRRIAPGSGG